MKELLNKISNGLPKVCFSCGGIHSLIDKFKSCNCSVVAHKVSVDDCGGKYQLGYFFDKDKAENLKKEWLKKTKANNEYFNGEVSVEEIKID